MKTLTPWYHGWNVLAVGIFTTAVALGVMLFSFTFYVVEWVEEFGSSRGYTMLALSATQLCAGLLFPFAGRAMDKYPMRWIAGGGIIVFALSLILVSFAQSVLQIIIIYGVFIAAADALAGPLVAQTLAAKWFRANRGLAIGLAALGTSIGGFFVPPLVAFLIIEYGWRTANIYIAFLVVVATLPLLFLVLRGAPGPGDDIRPGSDVTTSRKEQDERNWTTREILTNRTFWLIVIAFLPLMEMSASLISNLALWAKDFGVETQKAAYLMSLLSLMMIVGKIGFGYLADRMEVRILFFVSVGMLVFSLMLMVRISGYPLMLLATVVAGLALGGLLPLSGILLGRVFGAASFGAAMGLFYLCIRPVAFGGPIGGWTRDYFGSYDYFWIAGIIVILVFSPALLWVREPRQ